jgi:hypothetical protein
MRRILTSAAVAVVLVAASASLAIGRDDVRILVTGPADWADEGQYRLEAGGEMWIVDTPASGLATVNAPGAVSAVWRRVRDCREVLRFDLGPGSRWVIRAVGNGTFGLEDHTADGLDAGPSMTSVPFSPCLPDTATVVGQAQPVDLGVPFLVATASLGGLAFAWRRRLARPRRPADPR